MFAQMFIIVMGVFLIVTGAMDGDYVNLGLGALIAGFAANTLYKLKTGN